MPVPNHSTPNFPEAFDRFVQIAKRRCWWLVLGAVVVSVGAGLGSFLIPNRYKSEAMILVQQQQIPERYVVPNNRTDVEQALQAMTHEILSRPRLLSIISDFKLYPGLRDRLGPEQLVELMRKDITIAPVENADSGQRETNAFTIAYIGSDPGVVQAITTRLTTLFINEDLTSQQQLDTATTNFLQSQLDAAQRDLAAKEERLRDFKMANLGELPEQQTGNLQILGGLQDQLQNTNAAFARANEQQAYLESLLSQYQNLIAASGTPASGASPLETARAELNRLQTERTSLRATFSGQYPDVKKVDRQIAETRALIENLEKPASAPLSAKDDSSGSSRPAATTDATVAQLNSQLKENKLEIANETAQAKQLQQEIEVYQHRLNLTPVREQQLTDLLRDYDLAKKNYDDLYAKRSQSALATDLQRNQEGQQFRLIDPPNLPSRPFTPNRIKIALGGLAGGIALGIALAFFVETRDASLHSEKELRAQFNFPIVMAVPRSASTRERRVQFIFSALQWCAGTLLFLAVLATEYYVYLKG